MSTNHDCRESMIEVKATPEAPYRFTDAGLPNVFLAGIKYYVCKVCEKIVKVQIPAVEEMLNAIASAIVLKHSPLKGVEVQFLRKRLGIKQSDFALILDASTEQLSRWENEHNGISGTMDRFIRLAYTFISKDERLKQLALKVQKEFQKWSTSIQQSEAGERIVAEYKRHWSASAAPMAA